MNKINDLATLKLEIENMLSSLYNRIDNSSFEKEDGVKGSEFLLHNKNKLEGISRDITQIGHLEDILRDPSVKIAVLGKIGSGKSSLISSLLPSIKLQQRDGELLQKSVVEKIKDDLIEKEITYHPIGKSKFIERSSIIPVGKGRTTLSAIDIIYSSRIKRYSLVVEFASNNEILAIIDDYLDYLYADNQYNGEQADFPIEMMRFIRNSVFRFHLNQNKEPSKNEDIQAFLDSFMIKSLNQKKLKKLSSEEILLLKKERDKEINTNKDKLRKLLHTMLLSLEERTPLTFFYNEENYKKIMPKRTYTYTKNEPSENKEKRFFKALMGKINSGMLSGITIPKKMTLSVVNKEFEGVFLISDTKGAEVSSQGSYINSSIISFSEDVSTNILFVTQIEGTPTEDIIEVINEDSLYEKISYRSSAAITVKERLDESEAEEKYWHSEEKLPRLSGKFFMYDAHSSFTATNIKDKKLYGKDIPVFAKLYHLDMERREFLENQRLSLIESVFLRAEFLDKAITVEESKTLSDILFYLDTVEKTRIIDKINSEKDIRGQLISVIAETHHCRVNAMNRRNGVYSCLDVPSFLKVKTDSVTVSVFAKAKDLFYKRVLEMNSNEETKKYLMHSMDDFLLRNNKVIIESISLDISHLLKNEQFWKKNQSEWGSGPGFKIRVMKNFHDSENLENIDTAIIEGYSNLLFKQLLAEFLIKEDTGGKTWL